MSWKETNVMEERRKFIREVLQKEEAFSVLCKKYGISEKTGYKWKNRFMEKGDYGLTDESKRPKNSPSLLSEDTVIRLVKLKLLHLHWGPKKIKAIYERAYPAEEAPSVSSINRILGKAGLVEKRKVKAFCDNGERMRKLLEPKGPNDVWTIDFKGYWYSDGEKCNPLTIRDLSSKMILKIMLMRSGNSDAVKEVFKGVFAEYGMPKVIRSDNGTPFASHNSLLGLTALSAWWITLGIMPDRTHPGTPTENGSHERMHRDISQEVQKKIPGGVEPNQIVLNEWVQEYNEVRPHEALGMKTPSEVYEKSDREYYGDDFDIEYPIGILPRKVAQNGVIKIGGVEHSISTALRGLTVGLQQTEENKYFLWLNSFPLGVLDTNLHKIEPYRE
jgi:transposase InsO family protein